MAIEITIAAVIGGFAGLLLLAVFDPRGEIGDVDMLFFVIAGALVGIALGRTVLRQ